MPRPHPKVSNQKIRAAFEALGTHVTQHDVALRAELSDVSISGYLSGSRRPTAKNLPALAKALGVTEADLLQDDSKHHRAEKK